MDLEHHFTIEVAWNKVVAKKLKHANWASNNLLVGLVTKVTSHNKKTKA
jgi:hypothetical protein